MNRKLQALAERLAPYILPILLKLFTDSSSSWVPTYFGLSTAGVTTYSVQAGFWTRILRIYFFNARVVWTNATGTGVAAISLPVSATATANSSFVVGVRSDGLTFANNNVVGRITNASHVRFDSLLTNAAPTAVNVETAGDVIIAGWFYID
jgi:hypothetical protein